MKIFKYLTIGLLAFSNIFDVRGQDYAAPPPLTQEELKLYAETVLLDDRRPVRPQQEGLGQEYIEDIYKDIDRLHEMQKEGHGTDAIVKELKELYNDLASAPPEFFDDYLQNSERTEGKEGGRAKRTEDIHPIHSRLKALGGGRKSKKKKRKSKKRKSKKRKSKKRSRTTKRK